jgi:hypothetical protein
VEGNVSGLAVAVLCTLCIIAFLGILLAVQIFR